MGLFRKSRRSDDSDTSADDAPEVADVGDVEDAQARAADDTVDDAVDAASAQAPDTDTDQQPAAGSTSYSRARGPFDLSELAADDDVDRLDLGSIRLVPRAGMQLRFELDEAQTSVTSVHAALGTSGVQLQAFAAPRGDGLWDDIRSEIAASITAQGGKAEVADGPLGPELNARLSSRGANGKTVSQDIRFLGVDGPRWFLRAVLSGPAVGDPRAAEPLLQVVRDVVVVRDGEARPPREALPLVLPTAPEDASGAEVDAPDSADSAEATQTPTRSADDLRPFERGPEITEVR